MRKKWDSTFNKGEVIRDISESVSVIRYSLKPAVLTDKYRDFVVLRSVTLNQDGNVIVFLKSADPKLVSHKKNYSRCEVPFAGWYIVPTDKGCMVYYHFNVPVFNSLTARL